MALSLLSRSPALTVVLGVGLAACTGGSAPRSSPPGRLVDAGEARTDAGDSHGRDSGSLKQDAGGAQDVDAGSDAGADDDLPEGPLAWESATTTTDDGKIVIEKVVYLSDGLRVVGQVCRPHPSAGFGPGPYPVQVLNHGGFSGISVWNGGTCADSARKGWVVGEASYRGEDGSEGSIEVCLGEVTDVLRLTSILLAQSYSDPARVLMSGTSHGGCITLRALQRGAPVQVAVDIFGPTDWAQAYSGWRQALAQGTLLAANYRSLTSVLEQATGGTPEAFPEEYARRSPITFPAALERSKASLLVLQGTTDAYVPPAQSCALADVSATFESFHVSTSGAVLSSAAAGCEAASLTWQAGPRPSNSWPSPRYLMVYDDVGHGFEGKGTPFLLADFAAFLVAGFPP
jgi:dienelactone hydrolase